MLVFKKIRYKNFLSTGNRFIEIELCRSPTTLILGDNGSGKSTVIDAITFALFGKPFRKITKPQLINSINEKDCLVEVEFTVNDIQYLVRRGISPSILEIEREGKSLDQESKSTDIQRYLERYILNLNYKSFTQIVILGSNSYIPFMKLKAAERREVIEDLLDITIFSSMNKALKERVSLTKERLIQNESEGKTKSKELKLQKEYSKKMQVKVSDLIQKKMEMVGETNETIEELQVKRAKEVESRDALIESNDLDIESYKSQQMTITNTAAGLTQRLSALNEKIEFFNSNDTCPTCKQDIDDEYKSGEIEISENYKQEIKSDMEKLKEEDKDIRGKISAIQEVNAQIADIDAAIQKIDYEVSANQKYIQRLQEEVDSLNSGHSAEIEEETKKMDETLTKLQELIAEREQLLDSKNIQDIALEILKDSGIKTKIVKQYLPVINKLINHYLAEMDFFINFTLDEEFNESVQSRFKDNFTYSSFSEGQKMRIDLALLFTWIEIARMKNSANTNLLFLDEVFDGTLDGNGTDDLMKILKNHIEGKNVFVISHKKDELIDKFNDSIRFELHNNYSRRIS